MAKYTDFYKHAGTLVNAMTDRRQPILSMWQDIQRYLVPWHGRNLSGESESEVDSDERDHSEIFSQAPEDSIDRLASGFQFAITPRAEPWFSLSVEDQQVANRFSVRTYLYEVERRMRLVYSKSNLYDVLHNIYLELITFGTAAMAAIEDNESIIRFKAFTAGEYLIANNERGLVDTFYREFWMTAVNMKSKFGEDKLSLNVKKAIETDNGQQLFRVCQLIEPNDNKFKEFSLKGKAFRSVYYEKNHREDEEVLQIRGYNEFPIMVVRWRLVADDVYGRSPGMKVMPDVKSLYKIEENTLIALDKVLDPPLVAPGNLKNEYVDSFPGGVNYSDELSGTEAFRPLYQIRPDLKAAEFKIDRLIAAIQRGFFNDIFLMLANTPDTKRMTATEVQGRREEKMTMLGPVLGRLQGELLGQLIDRTFAIMFRAGVLPEPPSELRGRDLKIEYLSILAKAQEMGSINAMMQALNFIGALAGVDPKVLDKMNTDGMFDEFVEKTGVPPNAINSDEVVAQRRAARAQQEQAMQQMAAAQAATDMAATAGKTPLGDNGTVLDAAVEQAGGPAGVAGNQ